MRVVRRGEWLLSYPHHTVGRPDRQATVDAVVGLLAYLDRQRLESRGKTRARRFYDRHGGTVVLTLPVTHRTGVAA